jgi:UDP-2,3-diacylglucosamine pyrophosphatase LpxH
MDDEARARRWRTIWISDVHLGIRDSKASMLLGFLRENDSDRLYLIGDIVDGWALRRSWYWEQAFNDVVQKILRKARKGTEVIYVPGNHDEFARDYVGHRFGDVAVRADAMHVTADGRRLWVVHGDEFDLVIQNHKWLVFFGDAVYAVILRVNRGLNWVRRRLGRPYWSLAAVVKGQAKKAVEALCGFEAAILAGARARGADGVVCGHIHHAEMKTVDGLLYVNDGDWVDSCTALVEDFDGRLELIRWAPPPTAGETEPDGTDATAARSRRPAARPDRRFQPVR